MSRVYFIVDSLCEWHANEDSINYFRPLQLEAGYIPPSLLLQPSEPNFVGFEIRAAEPHQE